MDDILIGRLTTTSLGQLCQAQQSIVAGNWLKCDIRVPAFLATLFLLRLKEKTVFVDFLGLL